MSSDDAANNVLFATNRWFDLGIPDPTNQNIHTQLGVHFEEVAEQIELLHSEDVTAEHLLRKAQIALESLSLYIKGKQDLLVLKPQKQHLFLDAICDQIVTGVGVANFMKMEILPAQKQVNDSNWSKFVNGKPIFDDKMKIAKGPLYFVADVIPFTPYGRNPSVPQPLWNYTSV